MNCLNMTRITKKQQMTMPKPGKNFSYHLKENKWEFWQYPFTPTVLLAEKKIKWYDEEKLKQLWWELKKKGVRLYWAEATDKPFNNYQKQNTSVELYMKFPADVSFVDKVEKMKQLITEIGCF